MKIIKHGNFYEQGPITCSQCKCEFTYCQNDIKKATMRCEYCNGDQETYKISVIYCPECKKMIEIKGAKL